MLSPLLYWISSTADMQPLSPGGQATFGVISGSIAGYLLAILSMVFLTKSALWVKLAIHALVAAVLAMVSIANREPNWCETVLLGKRFTNALLSIENERILCLWLAKSTLCTYLFVVLLVSDGQPVAP